MHPVHYFALLCSKRINNFLIVYRFLRTVQCKERIPKLLKGNVRTIENNHPEKIASCSDFIKDIKHSFNTNDEKEIEQIMLDADDFTKAVEKCENFYEVQKSEDKKFKSSIKKQIIKRKYFKNEIETNLLTYAAKEQIHYLHQLDPVKWSAEVLAESFPISLPGLKKLLKNKFIPKSPQKIKEHDLKVAERWKILKSGQFSPLISFTTQCLWKEGKLSENFYSGNPNLPTISSKSDTVIEEVKVEQFGEYSEILKTYIDYKKEESQLKNKSECSKTNVTTRDNLHLFDDKKLKHFRKVGYHAPETCDDKMSDKFRFQIKSKEISDTDVQHHQFIKNLEEGSFRQKQKSRVESEYHSWLKLQGVSKKVTNDENPYDAKQFFSPIPKYEKGPLQLKQDKSTNHAYIYSQKTGYQNLHGKFLKSKVNIPKKIYKKGHLYKFKSGVYDDDGELLYKLPS